MGVGDEAGADGDDNVLTPPGVYSDDESTESSDVNKDDTISLISNKTTGSAKTGVAKKRVQFLPDGFLVRVREIPPRSNKSSSESDGSASDTSDSEGSDTESASDSEDVSSERDTPSPAAPTESQNKFATMPPLMYAAKGSYAISKQNTAKYGNAAVAKITGIDPATVPTSSLSSSSAKKSSFSKRARRSPSPKLEKRTRRNSKTNIEKVSSNKKSTTAVHKNENTPAKVNPGKMNKKRTPLKIKEGIISPPPSVSKQSKQSNTTPKLNNSTKLSQRRASSANDARASSPIKRAPKVAVSTSLTILPTSTSSSSNPPSSSFDSPSLDRVSRAMQSLTMGKLYTVDGGFIFPPHHAKDLHLPDLAQNSHVSKSEDFEMLVSVSPPRNSTPRRPSTDLGSPRRSLQESGHLPQQTPPQSANRKRRYYAWQMANGSIHNTLHSTPSISQLWDNPGRGQSDATDKLFSNSR